MMTIKPKWGFLFREEGKDPGQATQNSTVWHVCVSVWCLEDTWESGVFSPNLWVLWIEQCSHQDGKHSPLPSKPSLQSLKMYFINNQRWENDILELPLEKKDNSRYWLGHGDMGTLVNCCRDYEMMAPLWNIGWLTFKTIRNKSLYYPATPLLSINIQKLESRNCRYFYTNFHSSIIHNIQEIIRALFRSHCLGKCHGRNNFKSSDIIN